MHLVGECEHVSAGGPPPPRHTAAGGHASEGEFRTGGVVKKSFCLVSTSWASYVHSKRSDLLRSLYRDIPRSSRWDMKRLSATKQPVSL